MGFARLAGVPWSQYIVGKMRFSNDVLQFSTRFEGRGSRLRWVDEILSLESRQNAVAEWVPISSGASLSVSTLGMDFFRESLVDSLVLDILLEEEEVYLELVGQILASDYDVSSVSFSIVPGRESIPEWVLSLEMNESDAHPLVRDLQLHFRRNRDRAMLNAAWDEYREEGNADDPITYLDLIQSGYLADEGHNLWAEYSFDSEYGEVTGSGPESLEVLVDAYEQVWEDQTLSFILPPFTENDARYFLDEELDNIESLKDDEFRLCSAFRSGRLVFATDARTLIRLFSEGLGVIPNKLWSVTVQKFGSKQDLVRGLIRPTWAIDQGLLYESSDVQSFITRYLVDWDHYDTAFMSFGADQGRGDFYLDTTLIP